MARHAFRRVFPAATRQLEAGAPERETCGCARGGIPAEAAGLSEKDAKFARKPGQLQPFIAFPQKNLTPFSLGQDGVEWGWLCTELGVAVPADGLAFEQFQQWDHELFLRSAILHRARF